MSPVLGDVNVSLAPPHWNIRIVRLSSVESLPTSVRTPWHERKKAIFKFDCSQQRETPETFWGLINW
eukprot:3253131-Rhodomonas_salina.1